ncbi:hypothetical protein [Hydrogenivirga sp. 128-5-R1-1]|uniref:hypothetical protein n=1 Tax=Hydrogenivirga sp. 128-5-R1-1 TaxID=392423 RepID=UPI00015F38FF|nr:hypothetical protein [Hydrogenivirga sp. 128-5-R1-1]EDP75098.1 hypothetical protein HG1285_14559 [Hydrogenivirga sp. 128-5-R1-1]
MPKVHPATATANQSYKVKMTDEVVVNAIKSMTMLQEWKFHIHDFFADNPPQIILEFCEEYGISLEELRGFYEKYVKPYARNVYLEEVWKV